MECKKTSLWKKIIELNRKYEDINNWRYTQLSNLSNDLLSELGEIASNIKTYQGRGTNRKYKPIPTSLDFTIEFFDLFIYMVLGLESMNIDEDLFNTIGEQKLKEIEKRLEGLRNG